MASNHDDYDQLKTRLEELERGIKTLTTGIAAINAAVKKERLKSSQKQEIRRMHFTEQLTCSFLENRHGLSWSNDEKTELVKQYNSNRPLEDIAYYLKRSCTAVFAQLRKCDGVNEIKQVDWDTYGSPFVGSPITLSKCHLSP